MTDATPTGPPTPLTTRVKVGLALAVLLALADLSAPCWCRSTRRRSDRRSA